MEGGRGCSMIWGWRAVGERGGATRCDLRVSSAALVRERGAGGLLSNEKRGLGLVGDGVTAGACDRIHK